MGVIINEESSREKRENLRQLPHPDNLLKTHYIKQLELAPGVRQFLQSATLVSQDIKQAGDYSYSSTLYAGKNWRIAGDAGGMILHESLDVPDFLFFSEAFIDPFFSSGVHLALTGGLSAASTIAACIRGQCTNQESASFHNLKVGTAYTR